MPFLIPVVEIGIAMAVEAGVAGAAAVGGVAGAEAGVASAAALSASTAAGTAGGVAGISGLGALGLAGAVVGVGGSVMQMQAAKKQGTAQAAYMGQQAEAQKQSQLIEQRRADVLAQKDRYAQIRQARIQRAAILSGASNAGVRATGTSGFGGATGSIQSQLGENIGTLNQMRGFASQLSTLSQTAATAQQGAMTAGAKGQMWQNIFGAVSQTGQTASFVFGGGKNAFANQTIFSS